MPINFDDYDLVDISPLISSKTAVFPGDTPFSRHVSMSFNSGDHLTLSSINSTVHLGAHTDAPNHYHTGGVGIDKRPLNLYMGKCQVISIKESKNGRIYPEHLAGTKIIATRVLFKTASYPNPERWNGDFLALSPELILFLNSLGVVLVGIDTPSVDPANDQELQTHTAIYQSNMGILEGIILDHAVDGLYTLLALPLPLLDADASPVRAILLKEKKSP